MPKNWQPDTSYRLNPFRQVCVLFEQIDEKSHIFQGGGEKMDGANIHMVKIMSMGRQKANGASD